MRQIHADVQIRASRKKKTAAAQTANAAAAPTEAARRFFRRFAGALLRLPGIPYSLPGLSCCPVEGSQSSGRSSVRRTHLTFVMSTIRHLNTSALPNHHGNGAPERPQ